MKLPSFQYPSIPESNIFPSPLCCTRCYFWTYGLGSCDLCGSFAGGTDGTEALHQIPDELLWTSVLTFLLRRGWMWMVRFARKFTCVLSNAGHSVDPPCEMSQNVYDGLPFRFPSWVQSHHARPRAGERIEYNLTSSCKTYEIIIRDSIITAMYGWTVMRFLISMITDIGLSASADNQCLHYVLCQIIIALLVPQDLNSSTTPTSNSRCFPFSFNFLSNDSARWHKSEERRLQAALKHLPKKKNLLIRSAKCCRCRYFIISLQHFHAEGRTEMVLSQLAFVVG